MSGPHVARLLGAWRSSGPAYAALARTLRLLVLDGRLSLGLRLPGERELAEALGVSRTTTARAYALLRDEGFLASRRGSGSWTRLPADPAPAALPESETAAAIDLTCAAGAAPEGALHAALTAAAAELPRHLPGPGYDPAGLPVLRAAIAEHLTTARGVPTTPEQVLVTAGAQHAWTLLLSVLCSPGDRVLTEHPTYAAALDAIRAAGARAVPVPLLRDGWDFDMLAATLRQAAPRLAYLIVDFQNPTGLLMPAAEREQLVALARATRTPLVIDETVAGVSLDRRAAPPGGGGAAFGGGPARVVGGDATFGGGAAGGGAVAAGGGGGFGGAPSGGGATFGGATASGAAAAGEDGTFGGGAARVAGGGTATAGGVLASVAAHDPEGETVVLTGSMSKLFWPGLRIGWIRANAALVRRLSTARGALDIASPVLEQLVAVELLAHADEVGARQRQAVRSRRDALVAALRAALPEWHYALPSGGLSLWVELDAPRSTALAALADRHGVRLAPGPRFGVDGAFERFIRLPYSLPAPVLEDAVARLAVAWRAVVASAPLEAEPEVTFVT